MCGYLMGNANPVEEDWVASSSYSEIEPASLVVVPDSPRIKGYIVQRVGD